MPKMASILYHSSFSVPITLTIHCTIELAAEEEKKRQEIEKKKLLADKERQDILALQDKMAKEALARKGKAATAGDLQHQQSDDQPSGNYSVSDA